MKNIRILNIEDKKTISSLIKIGADSFASGYISEEYIMTYLDSPESFILVYEEQQKVVGFSICSVWDSHDLFRHTEGFHSSLWEQNIKEEDELKLGVIKTIAIDLEFRHKSIATALFEASEKKLTILEVEDLVVPAWVYGGLMPFEKILKKFDYKPWFSLEKFWISSCEVNTKWCPKRTENGCQCDSNFYIKATS